MAREGENSILGEALGMIETRGLIAMIEAAEGSAIRRTSSVKGPVALITTFAATLNSEPLSMSRNRTPSLLTAITRA